MGIPELDFLHGSLEVEEGVLPLGCFVTFGAGFTAEEALC